MSVNCSKPQRKGINHEKTNIAYVPFCTSASSGNAASERNIANLVPIGNQLEGKRFSASASKESVETWLNKKQAEIADIRKSIRR